MITLANQKKVPGGLPTMPTARPVEDLSKMTKPMLLELRDRQLKLLGNKQRIAKLPDKGARIQNFYERILKELEQRDDVQRAADLFSELNIASTGQQKLTTLEWTGKLDTDEHESVLDSDDDEDPDPLKIIAQGCTANKVVKFIKPEKSLITEADLDEIHSFENAKPIANSVCSETSSTTSVDLEPHVLYLFEKNVDHLPITEKFKPYKTTRSNVHDPQKEMQRKVGKNWENTAATPPLITHPGSKMLTLQESVELQTEYQQRMKKMQEQQASERMAKTSKKINMSLPDDAARKISRFFGAYREETEQDSESEIETLNSNIIASDEEIVDDVEDRGFVTYTVSS